MRDSYSFFKAFFEGFLSFFKGLFLRDFYPFLNAFVEGFLSFFKANFKAFLSFFEGLFKGNMRGPFKAFSLSIKRALFLGFPILFKSLFRGSYPFLKGELIGKHRDSFSIVCPLGVVRQGALTLFLFKRLFKRKIGNL